MTAPGTSEYSTYRDEASDPPALVCQVGSTTLKYQLQAIEDLHSWLVEQGDWVPLGGAAVVSAAVVRAAGCPPLRRRGSWPGS
ncbi:DUF6855 family protein [Arthrobacter sp. Y81]|uniref:DUF6855 family protein n=1 Tax=Arthrobacter sp. Y81 TaxID=2058897 RepID=UPI0021573C99|nr:hypothetical protein [Arthrobacter sp. Y81]